MPLLRTQTDLRSTYYVTWPNGSNIPGLHFLVCKMGIKNAYFIVLLLCCR